jgi:hypothetical protein
MGDALRALVYVGLRVGARRLAGMLQSPKALIPAFVSVVLLVVAQVWLLDGEAGTPTLAGEYLPYAVAGLLVVVSALGLLALGQCPVKMRTPDVAWVIPRPGGPRAVVLYNLALIFLGFTMVGVVALGVGRFTIGQLGADVLVGAAAFGLLGLSARACAYLTFLIAVRGMPRSLLALLWLVAGLGSAVHAGLAGMHRADVPTWNPLYLFGTHLVAPVILPQAADAAAGVLIAGTVALVLAVLAVALGEGYQEAAARLAWQIADLRSALRQGNWSSGPLADVSSMSVARGVPSMAANPRMIGDKAFLWRAWAQLRRSWRHSLIGLLSPLVVSVGVALWGQPELAALPLGLAAFLTVLGGTAEGLADEQDRTHFRLAPGSMPARVLAVSVVPFLRGLLGTVIVVLPVVVAMPGLSVWLRFGLLAAATGTAVLITAANTLAAALTHSALSRLSASIGFLAGGMTVGVLVDLLLVPDGFGTSWPYAGLCLVTGAALLSRAISGVSRRALVN